MICKRCGAEIPVVKFCPKCGAPVMINMQTDEQKTFAEQPTVNNAQTQVNSQDATVVADAEEKTEAFNGYDGEKTVAARDAYATVLAGGAETNDIDATVAARDYDATTAAPYLGYQGEMIPPTEPSNLDPKAAKKAAKAAKKANKKPMSTKKKVLVAISSVLAFLIVLGSVAVGVVAFTPKFKFMLAIYNTFNMKSFDVTMIMETYSYQEAEEDDSIYLWDYNGKDWEIESGSYSTTITQTIRTSYSLGETVEDSQMCTVSEHEERTSGSGLAKEIRTDDYPKHMDFDESSFSTSYNVQYDGELIDGFISGENDYAYSGEFYAGKADAYYEYLSDENDDYKPDVENHHFTDDYALDFIKSITGPSEDTEEFTLKEWSGIVYDLLSLMLKEGAITITDTRIEDGMTKYDVKIDGYLFDKCRLDYAGENADYKSYLKSKENYDGGNEYMELKAIDKNDYDGDLEFTLGTKGMRLVYLLFEEEEFKDNSKNSRMMECKITNINKKVDCSSQFSDIEDIAEDWKDNYTYCETAEDYKKYFNPTTDNPIS